MAKKTNKVSDWAAKQVGRFGVSTLENGEDAWCSGQSVEEAIEAYEHECGALETDTFVAVLKVVEIRRVSGRGTKTEVVS